MGGSKDADIYIIDREYRILYFSRHMEVIFPDIKKGQYCYRILCGEEKPCSECPLSGGSEIFYNKKVHQWVEVSASEIEVSGAEICNLICVKQIDERNKNLFFQLTNINSYDELFELNVTQNTYRILYHKENKYISPAMEGDLEDLIDYASEHLVHPDDRMKFRQFWNVDIICQLLGRKTEEETLIGEFRRKTMDGTYAWIQQIAVLLRQGNWDNKIVLCFSRDINQQKKREYLSKTHQELGEDLFENQMGLYPKHLFWVKSSEYLARHSRDKCCLVAMDIEHFKIFNEWYGQREGDKFLTYISKLLKDIENKKQGVAGYFGDDDFAILMQDDMTIIEKLQEETLTYVERYGENAGFLPVFGVYKIKDRSISAATMYDRALIAMESSKGNYLHRVGFFDEKMMRKMEERHKLLSEVRKALMDQEFTFYLQPKCNMMTGKIAGAESLLRWRHPIKGLIPPGEFIPLLEKYGFITNLDMFIWEKTCAVLRRWIDEGRQVLPLSINVSRLDIYILNLTEYLKNLTEQYHLPPSLLAVEITESAYVEESEKITETVDALRSAGFVVLMDDFGSGYSSLNMLKNINVDILKIDMKFLEIDEESAKKGFSILGAIINMAAMIGMRVIAEGVETEDQVNTLLDLGCNYAQGYYFYKPMPIETFENYLSDKEKVDFRGIMANEIEVFRVKDLINHNIFNEFMINKLLGGIAFYIREGNFIRLIRVNQQYFRITGSNQVDLEERKGRILESCFKEDREKVLNTFRNADINLMDGSISTIRYIRDDGRIIWLKIHVFFLQEQNGHRIYYASLNDVTDQKLQEIELESSQRALAAAMNVSSNDESFMKLTEANRRTAASIFAQMSMGGMIGGYCEANFPLYFANNEMIKLLGYDSYEEFSKAIDGKVINTIHPEDREMVIKDIGTTYYPGLEYTTTYRMPRKDGSWFWTLDKGKVIRAEDGRLAIVSACTDISEAAMTRLQQISQKNSVPL